MPHLDSTDATLILRHWIELRLSRRGLSFPRLFVYAALDAVAGRLDSTERANRITEVIRSMVDTEVHDKRMKLAATLRALMVTSATSTSHPVDEVIAAMKSASAAPVHIAGMGEAIAAAAQPSSAQLIEAFGIVCEAVERDDSNANLLLSHDLESLSKAIESSSLPSAGETLARMLHEVDDTVTARTLVPALKIIATNAPENSQLVLLDSVIESIRRTRDYTTQIALAECGRAITQHLNAVGAEKAGKRIVGAVRQLDSVSRQQRLVELEALAILLSGLSDRPAAWNSDDVRQVFRTALGETLNAWEIRSLAYSIMPLKRQLAPEFANEVNQLIGDAVNRTSDSTQLLWLAQAFNVLPQPIERRNRQGVANVIVERMQRESNPNQLSTLAKALGLVVSSEESLQAAQAATVLLDAIEQRVSGSHIDVMNLAGGLQSIEAALDSQSSDRVANRLLSLIGVSTRPETLRILIDCLLAVPTSVSQSDGTFAFLRLIASLEQTIDAASFWSPRGFDDISRSLELIPADIDGQQLIDILKRPNWTGVLETAIINRIESLAGRPIDGSLWDAVDWAVEKDLDVTGPPSKWSDHKDGRLRNIRHNKPLHTEPRAARVSEFNTVRRGPVNGGVSRLMRSTHVHVACTAR